MQTLFKRIFVKSYLLLAWANYIRPMFRAKARDAINRRLYKVLIIVKAAIYQKTLTKSYCLL